MQVNLQCGVLVQLSLEQYKLCYVPPELGGLVYLEQLSLSENMISAIPSFFGNLTNLTKLWLPKFFGNVDLFPLA